MFFFSLYVTTTLHRWNSQFDGQDSLKSLIYFLNIDVFSLHLMCFHVVILLPVLTVMHQSIKHVIFYIQNK